MFFICSHGFEYNLFEARSTSPLAVVTGRSAFNKFFQLRLVSPQFLKAHFSINEVSGDASPFNNVDIFSSRLHGGVFLGDGMLFSHCLSPLLFGFQLFHQGLSGCSSLVLSYLKFLRCPAMNFSTPDGMSQFLGFVNFS